jgi:hypothetical protein
MVEQVVCFAKLNSYVDAYVGKKPCLKGKYFFGLHVGLENLRLYEAVDGNYKELAKKILKEDMNPNLLLDHTNIGFYSLDGEQLAHFHFSELEDNSNTIDNEETDVYTLFE